MTARNPNATSAGLAHARDCRAAQDRQRALIAIAAGNAAARQSRRQVPVAPAPAAEAPPAGMTEQVRRLGIWRQVEEAPRPLPRSRRAKRLPDSG